MIAIHRLQTGTFVPIIRESRQGPKLRDEQAMSLIKSCKFAIEAVEFYGWTLAAAKAEIKKSANMVVKARSKDDFVKKIQEIINAEIPHSGSDADTSDMPATNIKSIRKLIARAAEETKGEGAERNGRIMMSIEGPRDFIEWAEIDLELAFNNVKVEGEGKKEGEISLYFGLNRDEKTQFMERWKQLKKAWVMGDDYP